MLFSKSLSFKSVFILLLCMSVSACFETKENSASNIDKSNSRESIFQEKNIFHFELKGKKQIALTYDDGPTPEVTAKLLNVLKRYNIKATFFILGNGVSGQESVLQKMLEDGHVIGNHSYSHKDLKKKVYEFDREALLHEIVDSHKMIEPFMNPNHKMYFRAPFGSWNSTHAEKLNNIQFINEYIGPIFWDVGGEIVPRKIRPKTALEIQAAADWDCFDPKPGVERLSVEICAYGYLKEIRAKQGGVVLMHDKYMQTVLMTAMLIPQLIKEGYEFVTLEDIRSLDQFQYQN